MENLTINFRYRILHEIGVGGFSLTYLAEDLHLPTRPKCVVKHFKPQIADADSLRLADRLFQQEAEILYRLGGHPNIPNLLAHFEEKGEFYLVQEFIEGSTLAQEFTGGRRYNQQEIIQLLGQTLEILAFVHSQKVIHRDIKPANLIRRRADGNIFLIDFGAVKQVNALPQSQHPRSFSTVAVGSHGYMPFEQMAGNPNFSSDLYALGLVAIEALSGTKPLDLKKNQNTNEFVWTERIQLAPEIEQFISTLIRHDFGQRFFSAAEALAALNPLAARAGFFNNRPQGAGVATIQPILNNQNHPPPPPPGQIPPPVNYPPVIPPTIIVPAQTYYPNRTPLPPASLSIPINEPRPESPFVKNAFWAIFGLCCFVGVLFVIGKVLNFRSTTVQTAGNQPTQINRKEETNFQAKPYSVYNEAVKQAQEAAEKEKRATTKFEWEEISNKYKRAFALMASIEPASPEYQRAQEKLDEYKQKSEVAQQKMRAAAD